MSNLKCKQKLCCFHEGKSSSRKTVLSLIFHKNCLKLSTKRQSWSANHDSWIANWNPEDFSLVAWSKLNFVGERTYSRQTYEAYQDIATTISGVHISLWHISKFLLWAWLMKNKCRKLYFKMMIVKNLIVLTGFMHLIVGIHVAERIDLMT